MFRLFFQLFFGCFTGTHSAPHPCRLFSGCFQRRGFGTSADGRRDCEIRGQSQGVGQGCHVHIKSTCISIGVKRLGPKKYSQESVFPSFRRSSSELFGVNGGRELNANPLFSNCSGIPGIARQNLGISRQKVWFSWVSKHIPNFRPPPLHVEDPHPTRKYPDQKV